MHSQQALLNIPSEFSKHLELRGCTKVTAECYLHDLSFYFIHLNKNIWSVSKMLGHSKLETTAKYLRSLDVIDDFSDEYQNAFRAVLS